MEFSLSGNAVKIFRRFITCLALIGDELVLESSPSQLTLHTIDSARSAYETITFKSDFFDVYTVSSCTQVQCSVLLKTVCAVLRTRIASIEHLSVQLADSDASKVQWTLDYYSGTMRKAYWITCNAEPDIQHLSLDWIPRSFVVTNCISFKPMERDNPGQPQDEPGTNVSAFSQRHPHNWVDEDEDDDEGDDAELCVQSTPPYL